jgi:hypothetical protein
MVRLLVLQAVMIALPGAVGPAHARSRAVRIQPADWEQGRPLWSLCEPRGRRTAAATPLRPQQAGPVAPAADVQPSWSDCEGMDGVGRVVFTQPAHDRGGMSSQLDDEDEPPICDGGSRCSPVPTERGHAVYSLTLVKAIAPPTSILRDARDERSPPPACIGGPDAGHPQTPFEPPRQAV